MADIKLKFIDQDYQRDAVNAIVDVFDGCQTKESLFTIVSSKSGDSLFDVYGYANKLTISEGQIFENLVEVKSPEHLRNKVKDALENAVSRYKD